MADLSVSLSIFRKFQKLLSKPIFVYSFLLVLAILFRTFNVQRFPFNFDQIQIAENSQKIFSGDLVLIGPRTGPAAMFTGPLIYYIAAPFQAVFADPYVVVATAVSISIITGITLLVLLRTYLKEKTSQIFFFLWALSPLLYWFDRVPWNPNLTVLSSLLVFLPLVSEKFKLKEALLISGGVFLGYQAHFSGLLLLPIAMTSLIQIHGIQILKKWLTWLIPLAFLSSLVPTLLFDFKHNWMNLNGLLSLLLNKDSVDNYGIFSRVIEKSYIIIETIGKVFISESVSLVHVSLGLFFLLSSVYLLSRFGSKKILITSLLWMVLVGLVFALYRHSTPEYYFFILLSPILFIISEVLSELPNKNLYLMGFVFVIYSSWTFFSTLHENHGFNIGEQYETVSFIKEVQSTTGLKEIIFDSSPVDSEGVRYLLSQENLAFSPSGSTVHVQFPYSGSLLESKRFSKNMSVWVDSRTDSQSSYLVSDWFILKYPKTLEVFETDNLEEKQGAELAYVVFSAQQKVAVIRLINKEKSPELFKEIKQSKQEIFGITSPSNNWEQVNNTTYIQENQKFGIVLTNLTTPAMDLTSALTFVFGN